MDLNTPNGPISKDKVILSPWKKGKKKKKKSSAEEPQEPVKWNTLKIEKKKNSRRNRKKKLESTASEVAVSSVPENDTVQLPIPNLNPNEKIHFEQNYVVFLNKKSEKNPKALYYCKLCKYHCNNLTVVENHIKDKRHRKAMEDKCKHVTLVNIPSPTQSQLEYLTKMLEDLVKKNGLTKEEVEERHTIAERLSKMISNEMPGFTVKLYGSSASGFGLKSSNVDLELRVPADGNAPQGLDSVYQLILNQDTYKNVKRNFCAKIPIVEFIDNGTKRHCNLTLSNNHSLKTAQLLSKYVSIDKRVWKLGVVFRIWGQLCRLDSTDNGMWPPYAFSFLVIYFLQQLKEPVLPVLCEPVDGKSEEKKSENCIDPEDMKSWSSKNTMSLGELWLGLLRFYVLQFDIASTVVSIQHSEPLLKNENSKRWAGRKIAIEDPFLSKRNVSHSMNNQLSFDYCMACFQNTYKYFSILQTKEGPIFDKIIMCSKEEESLKTAEHAEIALQNTIDNHPFFTKVVTGQKLHAELQRLTVPPKYAQEMFTRFNHAYMYYEFGSRHFVGSQIFPVICSSCQKEGHRKQQCKDEELDAFDPKMPPLNNIQKEVLNNLCAFVTDKWSITPDELKLRSEIISDMQKYILLYYSTAKLELFGSSCNGFGLLKSDIDICLTFTDSETGKELNFVKIIETLQEKLKKFGPLHNLVPVTAAKVPILKFFHVQSKLEGDISIYNVLGQQNTRMLRSYAEIDPRVKMLGYMIKRFGKVCNMCDASRGSLSSYAYIIMLIYFLQQCNPPVLPVLQELCTSYPRPKRIIEECDTYFYEDINNLKNTWCDYGKNTSSVAELWVDLLRFYSAEFDFNTYVVSIRQKELIRRFEKLWTSKCMAIEDPFELTHNLGAGLSRKMYVYIIKSFRKGYLHFASPTLDQSSITNPEAYYFKPDRLANGEPPNDRGCRICKKIGHLCKDCPQKKQTRHRGVATGGMGFVKRMDQENYRNPPRGRYRNPPELPMPGNFGGLRYGMPRASPPFRTCPPPIDTVRGLPPFASPRLQDSHERQIQECYEMAQSLGLIRSRAVSIADLKAKGDLRRHMPQMPKEAAVVDACPGRR